MNLINNIINNYIILDKLYLINNYKNQHFLNYQKKYDNINKIFNNKKIDLYIKDDNDIGTFKITINLDDNKIKILGKSGDYYTEEDNYSKNILLLDKDEYLNYYFKNNTFIIITKNEYIYISNNYIKKIIFGECEYYLHHIINFDFNNQYNNLYNLHYLITNKNIFILSENKYISNNNIYKIIDKLIIHFNSNTEHNINISIKKLINNIKININKINKYINNSLVYLNNIEIYNEDFDDRELYEAHYDDNKERLNNYFYKFDNNFIKFLNHLLLNIYKHNLLFISQKYIKKINNNKIIILNEFKIKTKINNQSSCLIM
jgi:hypothetical protein